MANVNVPLLQSELDHITKHPETWNQGAWAAVKPGLSEEAWEDTWERDPELRHLLDGPIPVPGLPVPNCQTVFCLAGNTLVHNGYTFVAEPGDYETPYVVRSEELPRLKSGERVQVYAARVEAARLLGLAPEEPSQFFNSSEMAIFDGGHTLDSLWAFAYAVTAGAIRLPGSLPLPSTAQDVRSLVNETMVELADDYETVESYLNEGPDIWRRDPEYPNLLRPDVERERQAETGNLPPELVQS